MFTIPPTTCTYHIILLLFFRARSTIYNYAVVHSFVLQWECKLYDVRNLVYVNPY